MAPSEPAASYPRPRKSRRAGGATPARFRDTTVMRTTIRCQIVILRCTVPMSRLNALSPAPGAARSFTIHDVLEELRPMSTAHAHPTDLPCGGLWS